MASKQRSPRTSGAQQVSGGDARVGSRTAGPASGAVGARGADAGWFGAMVEREPTQRAMVNGVSRPDRAVRRGKAGAAIAAGGAEIDVYSSFEAQDASRSMKSGLSVKVLSTREGWVEVEYREKDQAVTGWIEGAYYSDQPGLGMDEDLDAKVFDNYTWTKFGGDQTTDDLDAKQVEQGALGDCFFVSSMNAVGAANADFLEQSIKYDAEREVYSVRFFEGAAYGRGREVWVDVDAYLPARADGEPAYASYGNGGTKWGPIIEKAYAKFKGGYDVIGEGGTGRVAMAELTGARSTSVRPDAMTEEEVLPFFQDAKAKGLAIYAGVKDRVVMETQQPFTGKGAGPYRTKFDMHHDWDEVSPGTLTVTDQDGVVGQAWESGQEGDKEGALRGSDVDTGTVDYKKNTVDLTYAVDVEDASKLDVDLEFHGVVNTAKMLIGNHAYSFLNVVDGDKLQFYNPWGSYQPKAITAAEFLDAFDSIATNQVPKAKTSE